MSKEATLDKRNIDVNGFVEVLDNPISAVGIYLYNSPPGCPEQKLYRVLRPSEELSKEETLDSLRLMPIIDDHPTEPGMLGGTTNAITAEKKGVHGAVGEGVYFDEADQMIKSNIIIYSSDLLNKIDRQGKKELSAGYWADYDYTAGVWNGQEYDAIQRNIAFNHVALVDNGRMGSAVSVQDSVEELKQTNEVNTMIDQQKLAEIKAALVALISLLDGVSDAQTAPAMDADEDEDKEKTEDSDEEDKEKTEDADDEEKDDDKKGSMDASDIERIVSEKVDKALADEREKGRLYAKLKPHIGVMDSSDMNTDQLAKYAIQKLSLKAKGDSLSIVNGYLSAQKQSTQDKAFEQPASKITYKDYE